MARILYVLAHSTEAPDRAATALATALASQGGEHQVALWLTGEGARLGVEGVAETLNEPLPQSAAEMLSALRSAGATLYVEKLSFERRQYDTDALLEGAELSDGGRLAELVADGWHAVTL